MQSAPVATGAIDFPSLSIYSLDILARLDRLEKDLAAAYEQWENWQ